MNNSIKKLPKGIGVAIQNADGSTTYIRDPYLDKLKWEDVRIDSEGFKGLPPYTKLYSLAIHFLKAAIVLCEKAGESGDELTWPQGSVVIYCMHLSTELFLKACLLRRKVPQKQMNHEIADLLRLYETAITDKIYHFSTPWSLSARDINDELGFGAITGIDAVPDQLYRYSFAKNGTSSSGIQFFSPGYLYNYMCDLENKWVSTWEYLNKMDEG
jgi:hypothetical protein